MWHPATNSGCEEHYPQRLAPPLHDPCDPDQRLIAGGDAVPVVDR